MPSELIAIEPSAFNVNLFKLWEKDWLLLTAGDFKSGEFNTMTVAWGSLGIMWSKPFAMVVVRKQRHTLKFLEKYGSFTLSAFPESYRKALSICGSKSGRDCDKIKEAGLKPLESLIVEAPGFEGAELVLECKKSYSGGMLDPQGFQFPDTAKTIYPANDYHLMFWGEIVLIRGTEKYLA